MRTAFFRAGSIVWLAAGLLVVLAAMARAQTGNPLLDDLLNTGVPIGQAGAQKLRPPTLKDGMSAAEQQAAIAAVLAVKPGQPINYATFTGDNLNTPFVFVVDVPPAGGPGHTIDLWFVVHDKLTRLADSQFLKNQFKLDPKTKTTTLQAADLKQRNIAPQNIPGGQENYVHGTSQILPTDVRLQVEGTSHVVQTTTATSTTIAGLIDQRFNQDAQFPNVWRPAIRNANGQLIGFGNPELYDSTGGYTRITELVAPPGAQLVEYHLLYDEPQAWFNGANLLRSKLPVQAQDDVRSFRRKLKLASRRAKVGPSEAVGFRGIVERNSFRATFPQRFHRAEIGGPVGRIDRPQHADADPQQNAFAFHPGGDVALNEARNLRQVAKPVNGEHGGQGAQQAAGDAQQQRLDQDHPHHANLPPADGPQCADLANPLVDRHDHRVEHADGPDQQRNRRGRPGHAAAELDRADVVDEFVGRHGGHALIAALRSACRWPSNCGTMFRRALSSGISSGR